MMYQSLCSLAIGILSAACGNCFLQVVAQDCTEDVDAAASGDSLLQVKRGSSTFPVDEEYADVDPPEQDRRHPNVYGYKHSDLPERGRGHRTAPKHKQARRKPLSEAEAMSQSCEPGPDAVITPDPSRFIKKSSLHDVVGPDGVLMVSLARAGERFQYVEEKLGAAGIHPSKLLATDAKCASKAALEQGCVAQNSAGAAGWCSKNHKTGHGCGTKAESAIADSHRRALLAARDRDYNWTMVIEDDTVLVRPERWDNAFKRAFEKVPPETQIVRLSWCMPGKAEDIKQPAFIDAGDFRLVKWNGYSTGYRAGGCTGAYMVHRNVIPEMLHLFPCCCAVDCCFENDLYNRVMGPSKHETRGMTIMMSMDGWGAQEYIAEHEQSQWGVQYGVMMQAQSDLRSTRTGYKTNLMQTN